MRRLLMVSAVAALMAAMVALMASTFFTLKPIVLLLRGRDISIGMPDGWDT